MCTHEQNDRREVTLCSSLSKAGSDKHGQNLVGLQSSMPVHCILNHSFGIKWHLFENNNTLIFGICELIMVEHQDFKNSNTRVLPPTVVIVGWSLNLSAGLKRKAYNASKVLFLKGKKHFFYFYYESTCPLLLHWSLGQKMAVCVSCNISRWLVWSNASWHVSGIFMVPGEWL